MIRRRCGETVLLGDDIEIQVLEISGNRVKLGVSAPRELLVLRKELRLAQAFNQQAAAVVPLPRILSLVNQLPLITPVPAVPGENRRSAPKNLPPDTKVLL
jgi:carbon storage regulator